MIIGEQSRLPLYYESLNGSIKDVSTLENVLKIMSWINMQNPRVVMDKGFYSEQNVDSLYEKGFCFLLGVPFTSKWVLELVGRLRGGMERFSNFRKVGKKSFFVVTDTTVWKGQTCFRHVFFDAKRAVVEYDELLLNLLVWKSELESGRLVVGHQKFYERYFVVEKREGEGVSGGGVVVRVCEEAVLEFKVSVAGFFVLLSNDVSDAVEAFLLYREKDVVEKGFCNLKNALDVGRLRIHGVDGMDGRLFVSFVALVLSAGVRNVMVSSKLDERYTLSELMNELKSFHRVCLEGQQKPIFTKLSKAQREIFTAFKITEESYV